MNGNTPLDKGERIAKRLARAGLGSRRDAERWIEEGRVKLNGTILASAATLVDETSVIHVDDILVPEPEATRVWRYHKPAGLVTTHKDEHGRATLFETLPPELGRVISVGRLDYNSEGLLLLTNDGEMARRLELPANGWVRRYKVRVHGYVDPIRLVGLEAGITIDGIRYGAIKAELERQQGANAWLILAITEGKNREIRRVMEYLGYPVSRLIRLSYGPFQLGTLESGGIDEIPRRMVRDQLGMGPVGDKGRKTAPLLTARATVTRNVKGPKPVKSAPPPALQQPAAAVPASPEAPPPLPRHDPVWRPDAQPIATATQAPGTTRSRLAGQKRPQAAKPRTGRRDDDAPVRSARPPRQEPDLGKPTAKRHGAARTVDQPDHAQDHDVRRTRHRDANGTPDRPARTARTPGSRPAREDASTPRPTRPTRTPRSGETGSRPTRPSVEAGSRPKRSNETGSRPTTRPNETGTRPTSRPSGPPRPRKPGRHGV